MKILTLIIPTRNRFEFLKKILLEIKEFNKIIDIIVIDDSSSIEVSKLIIKLTKKFNNLKYFKLKRNKGQSFACNYGLKISKTKYVWFFDDDDLLKKETLKVSLNFLNKNNIDGALLPMKQVYKKHLIKHVRPKKNQHLFDYLRNSPQKVSTSCAIFDRKKILSIGGWDERLFGGTDTDLFLRFSKIGTFIILKAEPVLVNFSAPNRVTNNFFRQQNAKLYILKKHWYIVTLKRKFYYIISYLLCLSILNNFKVKIKLLRYKFK